MKEKSDDKDDLVHENLGNWQNILYCDPIKTLARSALRWKSCCFQSGAGNMEGEFEDAELLTSLPETDLKLSLK